MLFAEDGGVVYRLGWKLKEKISCPSRESAAGFSLRNQALYRKILAKTNIYNDDNNNNNNNKTM
jgi:hypothetical protein